MGVLTLIYRQGERKMPEKGETKYNKKILPAVLDLMKDGGSKTEVCALIDISRETLRDWTDKESERFKQELSDTIKRGVELSKAWWIKNGRTNLTNKDFNYTGWYMNMKNRFNWADKTEAKISGDGKNPVKILIEVVDGKGKNTKET